MAASLCPSSWPNQGHPTGPYFPRRGSYPQPLAVPSLRPSLLLSSACGSCKAELEDLGYQPGWGFQGGLLLWLLVPEGIILAAALLLLLLAQCVGVQQAFARERRQKIKIFKLQFCRQIERPPNSSELPNRASSAHLPPRKW